MVFNVLTFCLIFVFNYVFGQVVLIIEEVDILVHQDVLFLLLIGIGFFSLFFNSNPVFLTGYFAILRLLLSKVGLG